MKKYGKDGNISNNEKTNKNDRSYGKGNYRLVYDLLRNKSIGITPEGEIVSLKAGQFTKLSGIEHQEKHMLTEETLQHALDNASPSNQYVMRPVDQILGDVLARQSAWDLSKQYERYKNNNKICNDIDSHFCQFVTHKHEECVNRLQHEIEKLQGNNNLMNSSGITKNVQERLQAANQDSIAKQRGYQQTLENYKDKGDLVGLLEELPNILKAEKNQQIELLNKIQSGLESSLKKSEEYSKKPIDQQLAQLELQERETKQIQDLQMLEQKVKGKIYMLGKEIVNTLCFQHDMQYQILLKNSIKDVNSIKTEISKMETESLEQYDTRRNYILKEIDDKLEVLIILPKFHRALQYENKIIIEEAKEGLKEKNIYRQSLNTYNIDRRTTGDQSAYSYQELREQSQTSASRKEIWTSNPRSMLIAQKSPECQNILKIEASIKNALDSSDNYYRQSEQCEKLLEAWKGLNAQEQVTNLRQRTSILSTSMGESIRRYQTLGNLNQQIISWQRLMAQDSLRLRVMNGLLDSAKSFVEHSSTNGAKTYKTYQSFYKVLLYNHQKLYSELSRVEKGYMDLSIKILKINGDIIEKFLPTLKQVGDISSHIKEQLANQAAEQNDQVSDSIPPQQKKSLDASLPSTQSLEQGGLSSSQAQSTQLQIGDVNIDDLDMLEKAYGNMSVLMTALMKHVSGIAPTQRQVTTAPSENRIPQTGYDHQPKRKEK